MSMGGGNGGGGRGGLLEIAERKHPGANHSHLSQHLKVLGQRRKIIKLFPALFV